MEMFVRVVERVVATALRLAAEAKIGRSDTEVMEKCGVV